MVNGDSSPAILYILGIIRSSPWDAVKVVDKAPACSAPWIAPAAPPSDCISAISGITSHRLVFPRLAHSSQTSAIGELGVIGKIAIASLTRNATEAAASLPSTVISFLLDVGHPFPGLAARMSGQHGDCATCDSRPNAVGAAGEDDRHSRSQDQTGAVGVSQEAELFSQDVAGFKVGSKKDVRVTRDLGADALG